jgi:hypothetical protein
MCGVFNILMFCLSSRRWFVLYLACIPHQVLIYRCLEIETRSIDWGQLRRVYLKTETDSSLRNFVL